MWSTFKGVEACVVRLVQGQRDGRVSTYVRVPERTESRVVGNVDLIAVSLIDQRTEPREVARMSRLFSMVAPALGTVHFGHRQWGHVLGKDRF